MQKRSHVLGYYCGQSKKPSHRTKLVDTSSHHSSGNNLYLHLLLFCFFKLLSGAEVISEEREHSAFEFGHLSICSANLVNPGKTLQNIVAGGTLLVSGITQLSADEVTQ